MCRTAPNTRAATAAPEAESSPCEARRWMSHRNTVGAGQAAATWSLIEDRPKHSWQPVHDEVGASAVQPALFEGGLEHGVFV